MNKTYIVLISVDGSISDPRGVCESIENMTFKGNNYSEIKKSILFELGLSSVEGLDVYKITEFMDLVNDEMFNDIDNFISYVTAN